MRRTQLLCFVMAVLALPSLAFADSFGPDQFTTTLDVGDKVTIRKTIKVDGRASDTPVDVFFLFDSSSSFGGYYAADRWSGTPDPNDSSTADFGHIPVDIVSATKSLSTNVNIAVGSYEDFANLPWGQSGDSPWRLNQDFTSSASAAEAAIKGLIAGSGQDTLESNLHALGNVALDSNVSWRNDSVKLVVWLGDAAGHVPGETQVLGYDPTTGLPILVSYPGVYNTNQVIAGMLSKDILVEALDLGVGMDGKVQDWLGTELDKLQSTNITTQTGGDLWQSLRSGTVDRTLDNILATISLALEAGYALYDVGLDLSQVPGGLGLSVLSAPGTTSGDRRQGGGTYNWSLQFEALQAGVYKFPIFGMMDGKVIGTENDFISVRKPDPGPDVIPEPTTFALLGLGLAGVGFAARRRTRKHS